MSGGRRVRVARLYEDPGPDDGERVLVDRLWARGFPKDDPYPMPCSPATTRPPRGPIGPTSGWRCTR